MNLQGDSSEISYVYNNRRHHSFHYERCNHLRHNHRRCRHLIILNQATTFRILPLLKCWSGQGEGRQPDDERLGRLKGVEQAMACPR